MTRIEIERLSAEHRNFIRQQDHTRGQLKKPKLPAPTAYGYEFDSKLELAFSQILEAWRARGTIAEWRYHAMRFRLSSNCTYEPDFCTVEPDSLRIALYEVKGSWKMKNARDSRTRLSIAASMYPFFAWYGVTRPDGEWYYETINAGG